MKFRRLAEAQNRRAMQLFAELGRTPRVAPIRDWGDLRCKIPGEVLLPKRFEAECGTESGYKRHRQSGERPCASCIEAHRVYRFGKAVA